MNVRHLMGPVVAAALFTGGLMSAAYAQPPRDRERGDRAEQRERGDRERGDRGERGRGDRGTRGGPTRAGGGPGGFGFGGPGGGMGMMMGPGGSDTMLVMLLGREEVREELELKPEQIDGLRKLAELQRTERPERPDFRNADREQLARMREQMQEQMAARAKETRGHVEEILSLKQMDRLEQIALQVRGPRALADEDVAEKLELSSGTVETLKEEIEEHSAKMRDEIRELAQQRDFEAMREKNRQMQQELEKSLVSHLTSEQKAEYEKLKGVPFDLPGGVFGRGGPGAFGGRGGAGAPGGGRRPGGFRGRDGGAEGRGGRGGEDRDRN